MTDPIEKDSGVHKYIVYTIKGADKDGPFETYRRYSDFNVLKKFLVKRWPGCYVPAIPEKKAVVFKKKLCCFIVLFLKKKNNRETWMRNSLKREGECLRNSAFKWLN